MLINENNTTVISCDNCGDTEEVSDFYEGNSITKEQVAAFKESGWLIVRDEDTKSFYHYCNVCK